MSGEITLKIKLSENLQLLLIVAIIIGMLSCCIILLSDLSGFNLAPPSDITLSNTYLCKDIGEECLLLKDNVFNGKDFDEIKICTSYISNKQFQLQVFLVYQEEGPFIGMHFENLDEGASEICYYLYEVVESLENSNIGGRYPSPVNNGLIDQGRYRIVFEKGRLKLAELDFEVFEGD